VSDPLNDFALAVYASDGVSSACLTLQDRLDVDVNVVLYAAYLGAARAEILTTTGLVAALDRVGDWHREVVLPMRSVRRRLKMHPAEAPTATAAAQLRADLQRLEIDAEMVELAELGALANAGARPSASGTAVERAAAAIGTVVGEELDAELRSAIGAIASAAASWSVRPD
jgi:uncharacterized protein (TIGR02444 family)